MLFYPACTTAKYSCSSYPINSITNGTENRLSTSSGFASIDSTCLIFKSFNLSACVTAVHGSMRLRALCWHQPRLFARHVWGIFVSSYVLGKRCAEHGRTSSRVLESLYIGSSAQLYIYSSIFPSMLSFLVDSYKVHYIALSTSHHVLRTILCHIQ